VFSTILRVKFKLLIRFQCRFQLSQNNFPEPHINSQFSKRLTIEFSHKTPVFSQTTQLTQPQHENRNYTKSNSPNNTKNSVNNFIHQKFILVLHMTTQDKLHQFKQQLHKMEYPWYKSTTTTYPIQQQLQLNMNSSQFNNTYHNSSI